MNDSSIFGWVCEELARCSSLSVTEARGTVRLVLKEAGLEAKRVNESQMVVVLARLLPVSLARLKVKDGDLMCIRIAADLQSADLDSASVSSAEDVFSRLAR